MINKKEAKKILENMRKDLIDYKGVNNISAEALYIAIQCIDEVDSWEGVTNLQYKRAVLLANSLTKVFNRENFTYSEAGWEASNIFREKQFYHYGIYPQVYKVEGMLVVLAILSEEAKK